MERVLGVGLWCVHPDYASRASIRQAMSVLQFEAPLPELPLEMPVATYGPPVAGRGYYWSTTTTSSSAGANTGGHSSTSDRTAEHSFASSAKSGGTHGTSFVTSNTAPMGGARESAMPSHVADRFSTHSTGGRSGTIEQFRSTR
ncbi:unnamed protein product [Miscanthus lutarioriparius]|uniref:Uncharacterized protein n=1 Tax=Miscanthus lutarioriparius TaxID=422564 RepID=A0A811S2F1_9POAL|nr:unnamed protein product [Miscanthus lutarioriparius]